MGQIKEYETGNNLGNKIYMIDSNILLAMSQFYYKGKCDRGNEVTENVKKFILKARNYGVLNNFAITEVCYDYARNVLNSDQMNKIMIAYDSLVMKMSENEILNHCGTSIPLAEKNSPRTYTFKSIFDCRLPNYFFGKNTEMLGTFYCVYLYFLKIYSLYFKHISPMQKIENLFDFMTEEIDIFLGYEFYMAVLLFLGQQEERGIAAGVFKPMQNTTLDHILNAVIDIFQYRMTCVMTDLSIEMKMPINHIFVTMDKPLQNYIEHNETYGMVMSENMITPINHFNVSIGTRYVECWNDFYEKRYSPCLEKRYIKSHTELISEDQRKRVTNVIAENIRKYEKEVFGID